MSTLSQLAALASRIGPRALAAATARRVYRSAQRKVARGHLRASPGKILAAHGVATSDFLVAAARAALPDCWADPKRRPSVLRALQSIPGARARTLDRAERVVQRTFTVLGTPLQGRIDWALDPVRGERFPPDPAESIPLLRPDWDAKYAWALGRCDWAVALAQGAWVAPDEARRARFVKAFGELTGDFLRANPPGVGIQWACPMEVSLRAANLAIALRMLADAAELESEVWLRLLQSSWAHVTWVEARLEDSSAVPNNHLLADHVGLLVSSALLPRTPGASRRLARAAAAIPRVVGAQTHPDGTSFEGSTSYHRLATELATLAYVSAGAALGEAFAEHLRRMYRAAEAFHGAQIGDNDSGRGLPLTERASLDQGYLSPLGAALFGDAALKHAGDAPNEEVAWLFGEEGVDTFASLPALADRRPFSSRQAGLHVLRCDAAAVVVSAGPLGQCGAGGHNHNDQLAFELHAAGAPILVDPGSPTYARSPAVRNAYRSTRMHNTWEVDGREQSPLDPQRLFSLGDVTRTEVLEWRITPQLQRLVVAHRAYAPLTGGQVRRTFELRPAGRTLRIEDALLGRGRHQATLRLHFPSKDVRGALASFHFPEGLTPRFESYDYSPGYGEIRPATRVVLEWRGELPVRFVWWVRF